MVGVLGWVAAAGWSSARCRSSNRDLIGCGSDRDRVRSRTQDQPRGPRFNERTRRLEPPRETARDAPDHGGRTVRRRYSVRLRDVVDDEELRNLDQRELRECVLLDAR
jgi:hypothetical protein